MARQIRSPKINIGLYAEAGKARNLTGEAISGVGAALGAAYEKAKNAKDKADAQNEAEEARVKQEQEDALGNIESKAKENLDKLDPSKVKGASYDTINATINANRAKFNEIEKKRAAMGPATDILNTDEEETPDIYSYDKFGEDSKRKYLEENPGDFKGADAYGKQQIIEAKAWNLNKYKTENPTEKVEGVNNLVESEYDEDGNYIGLTSKGEPAVKGSTTQGSAGVKLSRQKDSPLDRRRGNMNQDAYADQRQFLGGNQTTGVGSTSISRGEQSQFTEGRTFIEKDRRLSAPAWMGVGAAAVEGYNLGVDARNYKKQVQADLNDFYQQEFAGLEVERTGNDVFDASVQELLMGKKKEVAAHLNSREQAFSEGRGAEWSAQHQQLKAVPLETANLVDAMKTLVPELKSAADAGEIDWDAMSPEMTDELLSIMNGGANWGVADIEGQGTSLFGTTRGGKPYLKSVRAMVNELKGPKYIPKKNAFDYVESVVEDFRKNQDKYKKVIEDPKTGNKVTVPMSMEEITPMLLRQFDGELSSGPVTRAYASKNNWDDDGMTPEQFDASVKNNKDPKEFVKGKFLEVAEQMLSPYLSQYESVGTARTTQIATERASIRKENRARKVKADEQKQQYDDLQNLVRVEESVKFEGGGIVYTGEDGKAPVLVNSKKTLFTAFPEIKSLEGAGDIDEIKVKDGKVVVYYDQKTRTTTNAEGEESTSVTEKEPDVFLMSDGIETLQQNLANIAQRVKYKKINTPGLSKVETDFNKYLVQ